MQCSIHDNYVESHIIQTLKKEDAEIYSKIDLDGLSPGHAFNEGALLSELYFYQGPPLVANPLRDKTVLFYLSRAKFMNALRTAN